MWQQRICDTSDDMGAAYALGGKFEREDCGWFENCDHRIEKVDMTVPGGSVVEIMYCSVDWQKVGPLALALLVFFFFLYRRMKGVSSMGEKYERFKFKKSNHPSK